jgi:hypothetical protein
MVMRWAGRACLASWPRLSRLDEESGGGRVGPLRARLRTASVDMTMFVWNEEQGQQQKQGQQQIPFGDDNKKNNSKGKGENAGISPLRCSR